MKNCGSEIRKCDVEKQNNGTHLRQGVVVVVVVVVAQIIFSGIARMSFDVEPRRYAHNAFIQHHNKQNAQSGECAQGNRIVCYANSLHIPYDLLCHCVIPCSRIPSRCFFAPYPLFPRNEYISSRTGYWSHNFSI